MRYTIAFLFYDVTTEQKFTYLLDVVSSLNP